MRKNKAKTKGTENRAFLTSVVKGTGVAAGVSVLAIVGLAMALRFFDVSENTITIINQILKVASVVLGVLMGVGRGGAQGYAKGAVTGGAYMALGLGAALAAGSLFTLPQLLSELAIGAAVGALSGAVAANMPQKSTARA